MAEESIRSRILKVFEIEAEQERAELVAEESIRSRILKVPERIRVLDRILVAEESIRSRILKVGVTIA